MIYAIKEQNGGKLNSHLWVLRGIMPFLRPEYVVLFDVSGRALQPHLLVSARSLPCTHMHPFFDFARLSLLRLFSGRERPLPHGRPAPLRGHGVRQERRCVRLPLLLLLMPGAGQG